MVVDQVGNMWEQEEKQTRAGKGVFWVAPPPFIKTFIWWPELLNVFPAGEKSFCLETLGKTVADRKSDAEVGARRRKLRLLVIRLYWKS